MSTSTIQKITIILRSEEDWIDWIEQVETVAKKADIWNYINPTTQKDELPQLTEPLEPQPEEFSRSGNTTGSQDLTDSEFTRYSFEYNRYNIKLKAYQLKKAQIDDMRYQIQHSIDKAHIIYTQRCDTTYDILVSLKSEFQPTSGAREQQLIRQFNNLRKVDNSTNIDKWLSDWRVLILKGQQINLPDTQGMRPLFDIVQALQDRYSTFYGVWYQKLLRKQQKGTTIELSELTYHLKEHIRSLKPTTTRGKHSAFATFQEESSTTKDSTSDGQNTSNTTNSRQSKPTPKCPCGMIHWYEDCHYINISKRPKNWTPKEAIQKTFQDLAKIRPGLKKALEKYGSITESTTSSAGKQTENTQPLAKAMCSINTGLIAQQPTWELYNSFILDSGADTHVCHDETRFTNLRHERHSLMAGGGLVEVMGIGDVDITVQHPNGPRIVTLLNTFYVPTFPANLVSLRQANKADIMWDQTTERLVQNTQT
jgi:hypothetical protein